MSALHEAISRVDLAAMRASLDAGASPYSLDDKGRNAWDRINQNPMFHVHLGSKSRNAWTIRELLSDMAKVPPQTIAERDHGHKAHGDAMSKKVSGAVLVAGLIKKAILKLVTLADSHLDALGFENIGRRQVEKALAGRAANPSLPAQDAAQLQAGLEEAERLGTAHGLSLLQSMEVGVAGVVMNKNDDGTFSPAEFIRLDESLLQDFVDEVVALKEAAAAANPSEVITFELPAGALLEPPSEELPKPPHLAAVPTSPDAQTVSARPAPVGGRPPRLSVVPEAPVAATSASTVEAWRAERDTEETKPDPKPFTRPPRVG